MMRLCDGGSNCAAADCESLALLTDPGATAVVLDMTAGCKHCYLYECKFAVMVLGGGNHVVLVALFRGHVLCCVQTDRIADGGLALPDLPSLGGSGLLSIVYTCSCRLLPVQHSYSSLLSSTATRLDATVHLQKVSHPKTCLVGGRTLEGPAATAMRSA